MAQPETWHPISLFSPRYEVSSAGRVRRVLGKQQVTIRQADDGPEVYLNDGVKHGDARIVKVATLLDAAGIEPGEAAKARKRIQPPDYVGKVKGAFAAGWKRIEIAGMYGIDYQTVCAILAGRTWAEVPAVPVQGPNRAPAVVATDWMPVPGFAKYSVTRGGRIRCRIHAWVTDVRPVMDPDGVERVWLTSGRSKWHATVAEVVAAAWSVKDTKETA